MPNKTRFLMTFYDLVLRELDLFTSDECVSVHIGLSNISVRSTQTLIFSLCGSFIVSCSSYKFQCFLFLLLCLLKSEKEFMLISHVNLLAVTCLSYHYGFGLSNNVACK